MSGIDSKKYFMWRAPDAPDKPDGQSSGRGNFNGESAATDEFEIDFSGSNRNLSRTEKPSDAAPAPAIPANPAKPPTRAVAQILDEPIAGLDNLEIGQPGHFESSSHQHGVRLETNVDAVGTVPAAAGTPATEPAEAGMAAASPIMMIDEPLPESFSGNAQMQEMFVAEVLKAAGGFSSEVKSDLSYNFSEQKPPPAQPPPANPAGSASGGSPFGQEFSFKDVSVSGLNMQDIGSGGQFQVPSAPPPNLNQASAFPPAPPPELNQSPAFPPAPPPELNQAPAFPAPPPMPPPSAKAPPSAPPAPVAAQIPPSFSLEVSPPSAIGVVSRQPTALSQLSQESDASEQQTRVMPANTGGNLSVAAETSKKASDSEKTSVTAASKTSLTSTKTKSASAKKPPARAAQRPTNQRNSSPGLSAAAPSNVTAAPAASTKGLRTEVRVVIAACVLSAVLVSAAVIKQITNAKVETVAGANGQSGMVNNPDSAGLSVTPATDVTPVNGSVAPKDTAPAADLSKADAVTKDNKKRTGAGADSKSVNSKPQVAGKPRTQLQMNAADDDFQKSEPDVSDATEKLEVNTLLARPVSRFSQANRDLSALSEISFTLDRVQPRRVLSLLRGLPLTFGDGNQFQKNALRELTARYYAQVGALQKSVILFRQVCSDPVKTSDIEACLHAARAMILHDNFSEAKEIVSSLSVRLLGQQNEWREWIKLVETTLTLENPSVAAFTAFVDELADKGPFLTTEWNIQLSAIFARSLLKVNDGVRSEFLRSITLSKRRVLEVRLAPQKYGRDIGSFMFPAFMNLMFRHYELPKLSLSSEEPDTDSALSLAAWVLNVTAQANPDQPKETRARLAPLYAERGYSALARLIEGQLAAQAGDYSTASALLIEQFGGGGAGSSGVKLELPSGEEGSGDKNLRTLPFLYVEWVFLGVKISAGLNDVKSMKKYLKALELARGRYPELNKEFQFWILNARAQRLIGNIAAMEAALSQAGKLAANLNQTGFVGAERVWLMMKSGKRAEAQALSRQLIQEIPNHARLLEVAAEASSLWGEDASKYLKLEAAIPRRLQGRGRDSELLSFFTISKLLVNF